MRIPRWSKFDPSVRLFDVECECGFEFRAPVEIERAGQPPADGFLVPVSGQCPACGLRLEEIEPFGDAVRRPPGPGPRSRA